MAKQIEIPSTDGATYLLPTSSIMMIDNQNGTNVVYAHGTLITLSSIADLVSAANEGGVEQLQVSTVRVNDSVQTRTIPMSFPINLFSVNNSTLSGSNAVIIYRGVMYYVLETMTSILAAIDAGGGGTPTLDDVMAEGATLTANRSIVADTSKELSVVLPNADVLFNAGPNGSQLLQASLVSLKEGGVIRMVDTATQAVMNAVITNGAWVISAD